MIAVDGNNIGKRYCGARYVCSKSPEGLLAHTIGEHLDFRPESVLGSGSKAAIVDSLRQLFQIVGSLHQQFQEKGGRT